MRSGFGAKHRVLLWWIATIAVAAALFAVSLSDTAYNLTSPPGPWQIILRKTYSVGAFALVGYLLARSCDVSHRSKSLLFVAASIAAYSALIEIAQALAQAHEGLVWNIIDVTCGFLGGYLGALLARQSRGVTT